MVELRVLDGPNLYFTRPAIKLTLDVSPWLTLPLTRALADATRTHLAVRGRPGPTPEQIVVAFPWRRRGAAEAFARELAPLLAVGLDGRRSMDRAIAEAAQRLDHVAPGAPRTTLSPTVPVTAGPGTAA